MKKVSKSYIFNKVFYLVFAVIIFALISISVYAALPGAIAPNPGHSYSQVYIEYGTNYVTLQHAFERGYLSEVKSNVLSALTPSISDNTFPLNTPWHYAKDILIQVQSASKVTYTMTLQEAVDHDVFINGATQSYTTTLPTGGQRGSDINVITGTNATKSLQQIIDAGEVSLISTVPGDSSCINSNGTYVARGTACNLSNGVAVDPVWHACNGQGLCQGWTATGCGSNYNVCPFGGQFDSSTFPQYYYCKFGTGGNYMGRYYLAPDSPSTYGSWYSTGVGVACHIKTPYDCNCGISGCSTCYHEIDTVWELKPAA